MTTRGDIALYLEHRGRARPRSGLSIVAVRPPPALTFTRIDATHFRVDFASPVLLLPTLTWPGAYELTPQLGVVAVTAGPATPAGDYDSVEYVTVTTEEQSPAEYGVIIFGLEAA